MLGESGRLIPHLAQLKAQLDASPGSPPEVKRARAMDLQRLPYSLNASHYWLTEIGCLLADLASAYTITPDAERISMLHIGVEHAEPIEFAIDAFLDAGRRAQNALMPYLSKSLSVSLPSSLQVVITQIEKNKSPLPQELRDALLHYWQQSGLRLKQYRDLAQHNVVVCSDVHLFRNRGGDLQVYIKLPSDPSVKALSVSYSEPVVHALPYVTQAFLDLLTILYRITAQLILPSHEEVRRATIVFKEPLSIAAMTGPFLPSREYLTDVIKDWHATMQCEGDQQGHGH